MRNAGVSGDRVSFGDLVEVDFDEASRQEVQWYVDSVTKALGIAGACSYVEVRRPFAAYLAVDGRLARFPERDVALLWDEERGWAMAVETDSAEDPLVLTRMSGELAPPPQVVAEWVADFLSVERETSVVDREDVA